MKFSFRNAKLVVNRRVVCYNTDNEKKGELNMTFGEKLSKERKANNYTQEQLADILGVSRQSVSKWELDVVYPETDKLIKLGELFDCSMDYLLKENVTERTGSKSGVFYKKIATEQNKRRFRKILKIVGIVLGVLLIVDIISMIAYFSVCGIPH